MCVCKYPDIHVKLVGEDGNAFVILGRVGVALRSAGISKKIRIQFTTEATAGDYDHLLQTVMGWVNTTSDALLDDDECENN